MHRFLLSVLVAIALLPSVASAQSNLIGKVISTQTTTQLLAGVSGQHIQVQYGSICVDANGVTTGIALIDSTPTNILGTSMVYVLGPGQCYTLYPWTVPFPNPTADGKDLQLVTTVGNGPVKVSLKAIQR